MEFSINSDVLKKEVNLLQGITEKKSGIVALSSLLIETTDKGIRLTGTDLDTTIQSEVAATVKVTGSVCIPAKKLSDIAKNLDTGDVKFKKDANDWVRVTCNTSKFRMAGMSKDNFPDIASVDNNEVTIDGDTIKSLIKHTCFAVTQEESRFALNGAKLTIDNGKITMVATDGHRIALMEDSIDDIEADLDVLIPKRALVEVEKFVGNEVIITDDNNHIKFQSDDRILLTRKLVLPFPNYALALPKNNDVEVAFEASEMVKALKRIAIMADENSRATTITLHEDKMVLTANTTSGECEETVNCTVRNYPEDGFSINLSWQYLTEYLEICKTPIFKFRDSNTIAEVIEETSRYLVMPLRKN